MRVTPLLDIKESPRGWVMESFDDFLMGDNDDESSISVWMWSNYTHIAMFLTYIWYVQTEKWKSYKYNNNLNINNMVVIEIERKIWLKNIEFEKNNKNTSK